MIRTSVDGLTIEYTEHGAGEPVVLIHAGLAGSVARHPLEAARDRTVTP